MLSWFDDAIFGFARVFLVVFFTVFSVFFSLFENVFLSYIFYLCFSGDFLFLFFLRDLLGIICVLFLKYVRFFNEFLVLAFSSIGFLENVFPRLLIAANCREAGEGLGEFL